MGTLGRITPMKLRLSDTPPVAWGGRAGRYLEFPGSVIRAYDPYSLTPISFALDYEINAWHQVRFASQTRSTTGKPTKVRATIAGELLTEKTTFTAVSRSGELQYHLVCKEEPAPGKLRNLLAIAQRCKACVVVHRRAELMSDMRLNWRLARLRQASVVHLRDGPSTDPLILAAVHDGAKSRTDLRHALPDVAGQLIDGRVAHLHCCGLVEIDTSLEDYTVSLRESSHV
jgi:hypothetical protein